MYIILLLSVCDAILIDSKIHSQYKEKRRHNAVIDSSLMYCTV